VEPRKEKENWPLGNESRSPGSGRRGAQLRGARGRQGGGGGRSAGSGLEKTDGLAVAAASWSRVGARGNPGQGGSRLASGLPDEEHLSRRFYPSGPTY
jgi:hypothetical protein